MNPNILFEDEDMLVLDKPAGWIVNKADTTKGEKTVQEWVEKHFVIPNSNSSHAELVSASRKETRSRNKFGMRNEQVQHDAIELEFQNRGGIVHRLDKETSGILVVAKNPEAFENLKMQFKERRVKKVYTALCHGKVEPSEGEINVPIGRLPWNRMRFGVVADGRDAVTKYKVLSIRYMVSGNKKEDLSLLELYPETGRTHQIRVHLKHINHPIVVDALYAGRKTARDDRKLLFRMFLHASKISFYHPKTGKELSFESPLPKELEEFLSKLS